MAPLYRGPLELRRIHIEGDDIGTFGSRRLPRKRTIYQNGGREPTVLELRNVLVDPLLPNRLFTKHALRTQHFPSF